MISAVSLMELYKLLGSRNEEQARELVAQLMASKIRILPIDARVARKAGELRLRYTMPTADSLIAASGILAGATHVLTSNRHFQSLHWVLDRFYLLENLRELGEPSYKGFF